jgi:hypothetical protein
MQVKVKIINFNTTHDKSDLIDITALVTACSDGVFDKIVVPGCTWFAFYNDGLAGCFRIMHNNGIFYLTHLCVRVDQRSNGLATSMISFLRKHIKKIKFNHPIYLLGKKNNNQLYEKLKLPSIVVDDTYIKYQVV